MIVALWVPGGWSIKKDYLGKRSQQKAGLEVPSAQSGVTPVCVLEPNDFILAVLGVSHYFPRVSIALRNMKTLSASSVGVF
jgi:hypothetical protein